MLRNRNIDGFKFVRQFAIEPFVVDFACREAALVIEIDGSQHASSVPDEKRTTFLNREGYSVLRFWNTEVLENRAGVLEAILGVLHDTPSPGLRFAPADLSPTGRGKKGKRASSATAARSSGRASLPLPVGERSPRSGG
jgi:very-short-patch-repair endonuclease